MRIGTSNKDRYHHPQAQREEMLSTKMSRRMRISTEPRMTSIGRLDDTAPRSIARSIRNGYHHQTHHPDGPASTVINIILRRPLPMTPRVQVHHGRSSNLSRRGTSNS